jgi:uncharacterized heparinase superfamily protein
MRRLRRFLASVLHTRPAQLAWRARNVVSRAAASRFAGPLRDALRRRAAAVARGASPGEAPCPLPARAGMFRREGDRVVLRFLGREMPFARTIDWGVAREGRVSQLWGFHLHYHEFLEEAGTEDFQAIVLDWIARNPPYAPRAYYDAWSSYALSLRVVVWMQQIARRRDELPPAFLDAALRSLVEQVLYLEAHLERDVRGNHIIKNLKALLFAARFLGIAGAEHRRDRAASLLAAEIDEQILPDGLHFERSPAYHAQVFADLIECHEVLPGGPRKASLAARLDAMAQALADTTHPDGLPSLFNDGGLHMAHAPADLLAAWEAISGRRPAPRPEIRLDAAGYFGLRTGDDLLLVDAGRIAPDFLPAHGHGDILAVEWSAGGRRLLVDTGVFEYAPGPRRDRARATASHNTVTVNGADQCEFYGSFRVGRRANVTVERAAFAGGAIDLAASHDGYRRFTGAGVHRRTVRGRADAFTIEDSVAGTSGVAEAWLVLHPDARVTIDGTRARIVSGAVSLDCEASAPFEAQAWEWWPDFGVAVATTRLRVVYGPLPARGRLSFRVVGRP